MAKVAILGGSRANTERIFLAEIITHALIGLGHEVYHGGVESGVMQGSARAGGQGIVFQALVDRGLHGQAVNVSLRGEFGGFGEIDFGHAIRQHLLTVEMDLVIMFEGAKGTFFELAGALKAGKTIVFIGHYWYPLTEVLAGYFGDCGFIVDISEDDPLDSIMTIIEAALL